MTMAIGNHSLLSLPPFSFLSFQFFDVEHPTPQKWFNWSITISTQENTFKDVFKHTVRKKIKVLLQRILSYAWHQCHWFVYTLLRTNFTEEFFYIWTELRVFFDLCTHNKLQWILLMLWKKYYSKDCIVCCSCWGSSEINCVRASILKEKYFN